MKKLVAGGNDEFMENVGSGEECSIKLILIQPLVMESEIKIKNGEY